MKEKNEKAAIAETPEKEAGAKKEKALDLKAKDKGSKRPNGFVRFFKRIGRAFKEGFNELKKVTWPSFPKVVKQTGVVLVVCLIFTVILTAMDAGLAALLKLLT